MKEEGLQSRANREEARKELGEIVYKVVPSLSREEPSRHAVLLPHPLRAVLPACHRSPGGDSGARNRAGVSLPRAFGARPEVPGCGHVPRRGGDTCDHNFSFFSRQKVVGPDYVDSGIEVLGHFFPGCTFRIILCF